MQYCVYFEAVDQMLQDIRSNNHLFEGLPMIKGESLLKSYLLFVQIQQQQL